MSSKPSIQAPLGFKLRHTLRGHRNTVYALAWSPDGKMLASPSGDRLIHIWDTEIGEICNTIKFDSVENAGWSPNGKIFISSGDHRKYDSVLQAWDSSDFRLQYLIEAPQEDRYFGIGGRFAWSPDSFTLAVWGYSGDVKLFDTQQSQFFKTLKTHGHNYRFGNWSPNGKFFALATQDKILIWDIESGEIVTEIEGYYEWNCQFAWSSDSNFFAFGGTSKPRARDYNVRLWNIPKNQLSFLEGHKSAVRQVSFSYDGRLLITKSTNDVIFWRCDTWQQVTVLRDPNYDSRIAINPKKSTFAILGENDRAIHIWDLDDDTLLKVSSSNNSVR